jgi:hypothetical protein
VSWEAAQHLSFNPNSQLMESEYPLIGHGDFHVVVGPVGVQCGEPKGHMDYGDVNEEDTACVAISMLPATIVGAFSRHNVHHWATRGIQDMLEKKRRDREIRTMKTTAKVEELAITIAGRKMLPPPCSS